MAAQMAAAWRWVPLGLSSFSIFQGSYLLHLAFVGYTLYIKIDRLEVLYALVQSIGHFEVIYENLFFGDSTSLTFASGLL